MSPTLEAEELPQDPEPLRLEEVRARATFVDQLLAQGRLEEALEAVTPPRNFARAANIHDT